MDFLRGGHFCLNLACTMVQYKASLAADNSVANSFRMSGSCDGAGRGRRTEAVSTTRATFRGISTIFKIEHRWSAECSTEKEQMSAKCTEVTKA